MGAYLFSLTEKCRVVYFSTALLVKNHVSNINGKNTFSLAGLCFCNNSLHIQINKARQIAEQWFSNLSTVS